MMHQNPLLGWRTMPCSLALILAAIGAPQVAAGQVYNGSDDFSVSSNPVGAWSYGYTTSLGGPLILYDLVHDGGGVGLDAWWSSDFGTIPPEVLNNGTALPITSVPDSITWQPGKLAFHPGPGNQRSVVRWTAPESALVSISAEFGLIDLQAGTTDVHVLHNSTSVFDTLLIGWGDTATYSDDVEVQAGDTIDFVVGLGVDSYTNDNTSLDVVITVNQPPVADCGGDITVEAIDGAGTLLMLNGMMSTDADGDMIAFHWDVSDSSVVLDDPASATPAGTFPIGITMATLTVSDGNGGVDSCDVLVTVQDTIPPEVVCSSDIAMLWPPNHEMLDVVLIVTGTDAVADPSQIEIISVTVRSNEPDDDDGTGDGETVGDVHGADGFTMPVELVGAFTYDSNLERWFAPIQLRAEREGTGDGRCYTVDVTARDTSGNENSTSCCIVVPHDRRKK